ncbi:SLATT domain-containing protein [Photobacterium damselae]|nr:SLATT domain-containing protein [Photobacterium damselae]
MSKKQEEKLLLHPEQSVELIKNWLEKLENAQIGHYKQTEKLSSINFIIGICLITLTTLVTAFIFYEPPENHKDLIKLLLGGASACSAGLSGVVTFGRFGERADEHRVTAGRYGKLRRQLELLQSTNSNDIGKAEFRAKLKTLRIEWEYVAANAPLTPKSKKKWFTCCK